MNMLLMLVSFLVTLSVAVLSRVQGGHGPRPRAYGGQKGPHLRKKIEMVKNKCYTYVFGPIEIIKNKGHTDVYCPGPAVPKNFCCTLYL